MPLLETSALEAVSRALDSAPNSRVDPKLWLEVGRCHSALKEIAGLVDLQNNPPTGDYGGVPVNMYFQDQTVVTARASYNIPQGVPVRLELSGGELKALKCSYSSAPTIYTRTDAAAQYAVANGAMGEFILRGLVVGYNVANMTAANLNAFHSRVFASGAAGGGDAAFYCDYGTGDRDYAAAGVFLHAYNITTALIYFNPERYWVDKGYT